MEEVLNWEQILCPYEQAIEELKVKFNYIRKEYQYRGIPCPVESVTGRVKSISSIMAKANKKGIDVKDATSYLEDIAGLRVICQFEEDIYKVADHIRARHDMVVSSEVDYVSNPKPSGYRSYHIIIQYTVQTGFTNITIPVEIQIRTLAMNFWAVIEHSLAYKYEQDVPVEVRRRLTASAKAVLALDNEMSSIRSEILQAHTLFRKKENVVYDILNNLQSIYSLGSQDKAMELQSEFFKLYNEGDMKKLKEFNWELEGLIAEQVQS